MLQKRIFRFTIIFITITLFSIFLNKEERIILRNTDFKDIEQYDVILSSGQSIQSEILKIFNTSKHSYSHVGIMIIENNQVNILHSTPDGVKENGIRYDSFQKFINLSDVNYYTILRLKSITNFNKLNQTIDYYKNKKFPFDYDFSNESKEKLYCSELIFDIFNSNNLIISKLNLSKPIHPNEFLRMSEFKIVKERGIE